MKSHISLLFGSLLLATVASAQDIAPPTPQRLDIRSKVLNEDRVIWVRVPPGYEQSKSLYPVLYETDAPGHVNETGGINDFLVNNDRMPPVIIVGITNTDRTRDLTPSHDDTKNPDGTAAFPTSGGSNKFLEFIQTELIPEVEKRYRTAPYRIFTGHSLGGLFAIHALITRPNLFDAYIAVSPSLQWDNGRTLHEAQQFFKREELKKTFFFSLASEGNTPNPMGENFEQLGKTLAAGAPKGLIWESARYPDEDHGSTTLRAHYAGLKKVFDGWQVPRDEKTGIIAGGLQGVEQHYRKLSERYGYTVIAPENTLNNLGYQLMGSQHDEAVAVFKRNVELYPDSANVYDSLGEGLEAAGKYEEAKKNFEKAIEMATKTNDGRLPQFKQHLERVTAEVKSSGKKQSVPN
jgi:hypothetical protein